MDHPPLYIEVGGKVTLSRGLGSQFITWSDRYNWASPVFPWASAPAGLVRGSLTPWSGLLLVFGICDTLQGVGRHLLVGRLGEIPSYKASLSLAAFHYPEAIALSPGSQLALLTEIKGACNRSPWMRVLSSLAAISPWQGPAGP